MSNITLLKLLVLGLILGLISIGCKSGLFDSDDEIELFEANTYISLFTSYRVKVLNDRFVNSGRVIDRPASTWHALLKLSAIGNEARGRKEFCLFYRIPRISKNVKRSGVIKLMEINYGSSCFTYQGRAAAMLENIWGLTVYVDDELKKVENGKKAIPPYNLALKLKHKGIEKWMFFPLLNLSRGSVVKSGQLEDKSSYVAQIHHSSATQKLNTGVTYWPYIHNDKSWDKSIRTFTKVADVSEIPGQIDVMHFLGRITDSYPDKTLIKCHQVDGSCNTVRAYQCDRCRYGWFEVVGSTCKAKTTKFCGINFCGQRGWPACPRGYQYAKDQTIEAGCYNGSLAGFCMEGYTTYCDEETKVLICL